MYGLPIRLRLRQLFLCEKQYFRSQFLSQEVGNMPRKGENIFKRADGRWEGRFIKDHIAGKAVYGYLYGKSYKEVKEKKTTAIAELSTKPAQFSGSIVP